MFKSILLFTLLASGNLFTGTASAAPAPGAPEIGRRAAVERQDDEKKPDKRPEVKELLETLKGHARKRGKEDQQAIATIDLLMQEFKESGLKDRAAIAKGIGDCLKEKRKDNAEGVRNNSLYLTCAVALSEMGPESVKQLQSWIDHKTHRRDLQLQRQLVLSLGKTKHAAGVKTLTDLLNHREPLIMAAAGEALGNYDEIALKTRKDIFNEVMKVLGGAKTQVDMDVNDTIARERYDVIAAPMITTLQLLSGHDARTPEDWMRWWNDNKKKDWDKVD